MTGKVKQKRYKRKCKTIKNKEHQTEISKMLKMHLQQRNKFEKSLKIKIKAQINSVKNKNYIKIYKYLTWSKT